MATILVEKNHTIGLEEAKVRSKELLEKFHTKLGNMISEVSWNPEGTKGTAKGKMFSAEFAVTDTTVSVKIELGLLAGAMKGTIEQTVRQSLDKKFP